MKDINPTELKSLLDEGKSVFLKLWKPGCGACKLSEPAIERIEAKNASELEFVQISAADHPEMLEVAATEVLPVFFVFKSGENKGKHIGFKGLKKLQEFVDESL